MFDGHWGMTSSIFLLALWTQLSAACEVADCLSWLVANTPAEIVEPNSREFVGQWGHDAKLAGTEFYVFSDHSYAYAEWTDLFPLTIYDKGRWRVEGSVLILSPDQDVKWNPKTDRRFVLLKATAGSSPSVLGLDRQLQILKTVLAKEPAEAAGYLRAASLRLTHSLPASSTKSLRSTLLRRASRPSFFQSEQ